jgi:hypothetical protein
LVAERPIGLWEQRGWESEGIVQTSSAITSPRPRAAVSGATTLAGYAFAGSRTITHIELSVDGGDWVPVSFSSAPPDVWTRWQTTWTPPTPGDYHISVRAADSEGFTQHERSTRPFPRGSSAIHGITLRWTGERCAR